MRVVSDLRRFMLASIQSKGGWSVEKLGGVFWVGCLGELVGVESDAALLGGVVEAAVGGPEKALGGDEGGPEEDDIDEADAAAVELVLVDEGEDLGVGDLFGAGHIEEVFEDHVAVLELAEGEFSDDERVNEHLAFLEKFGKAGAGLTEVVNPDVGIDEDSHYFPR